MSAIAEQRKSEIFVRSADWTALCNERGFTLKARALTAPAPASSGGRPENLKWKQVIVEASVLLFRDGLKQHFAKTAAYVAEVRGRLSAEADLPSEGSVTEAISVLKKRFQEIADRETAQKLSKPKT